ncbi:NAD-binding protein [Fomitopsis schrenkii]|uniref:NAD-binding protein n=1 Tax=Fomitopsis schrenkii TaxID=2126942 RepID=S8E460_FOMSC|nr:NAD-binding protein [Fomitopsis schrenkii]
MFTAAVLLFILSTLHVAADSTRLWQGFVVAEVPVEYFADNTKLTWKNSINGLETFLADAVLIYRVYMLWRRPWMVIGLIIGWCGVVVAGVHAIWSISRPVTNPNAIFAIETGQWVVSFYSLTLATNLVATTLLAFKLWSTNHAVAHSRTHRSTLWPIMMTIIECGALYALTLVILLATYETHSNGAYVVTDIIGQVIPITFYLVIMRAAMIRMRRNDGPHITMTEPRFAGRSDWTNSTSSRSEGTLKAEPKPVEVRISRFVDRDGDEPRQGSKERGDTRV